MTKKTPLVTQDELNEMLDAWDNTPTASGFVMVKDEMVDQLRWTTVNNRVFKTPDGRYLSFNYETPNTEYQEGSESDVYPSDVYEVVPREVVTVVYERIPSEKAAASDDSDAANFWN